MLSVPVVDRIWDSLGSSCAKDDDVVRVAVLVGNITAVVLTVQHGILGPSYDLVIVAATGVLYQHLVA
jgi:hypothetical protein